MVYFNYCHASVHFRVTALGTRNQSQNFQNPFVTGDHKGLAEITLPIVAGKENLASVAEAILNQAKQLGPLLDQAEKVMLRHQATKAGMSSQSGEF